jgi:glycine betaine/proline transport system substrate-binding protein
MALTISACGSSAVQVGANADSKTLTIGAVAFDESVASSYLWKELLEEQGYTVKIDTLDVAPVYAGVANGQLDVSMALAPIFQRDYWTKYGNDFQALNNWYHGVSQAVAVPKSVGMTSMDQLAAHSSELGNQVIGIESGSGLMRDLHSKAVQAYHLQSFKIIDGSTPAMLAALETATKEKKPIAVTLWQPHWALSKYPVRILDDQKGVFGGVDNLRSIGSKQFVKAHPDVVAELAKFTMTPAQLQSLELMITEAGQGHEQDAVRSWIKENKAAVDQWTQAG